MAFDYRASIAKAMVAPFFETSLIPPDDNKTLQVKVERAQVADGQPRWEAICGDILTSEQGGGNPNIYLSAVTPTGEVEHQLTTGRVMVFGWDWEGRRIWQRHDPVRGDKPLTEPSANLNMGKGQIVTVWVIDDIPSDKVYNLRSDHPHALYHTSTFVCFRRSVGTTPLPPEPEPPTGDCDELKQDMIEVKALLDQAVEILEKYESD